MRKYYISSLLKANHNKDYSVVKTFSASPICGAFLLIKNKRGGDKELIII
jgi:hypothetical protein